MPLELESQLVMTAALLVGSVLASKLSTRLGVPALVLFLVLGMFMGSDGPGGLWFDDTVLAQKCAVIALTIILFSGGLDTHWGGVRPVLKEGVLLATVGVLITAGVVAAFTHFFLDATWVEGWLMGAIVSSTDAAAVFSVLKSKGLKLKGGSDQVLELESGINDPMAVFLTISFADLLAHPDTSPLSLIPEFFEDMALGAIMGLAMGWAGSRLANRIDLQFSGLYGPLVLAWAFLSYSATALMGGSGFLAVYLTGLVMGNLPLVHRHSLSEFFGGLGWLMQILMFLGLGLLVFPSHLPPELWPALLTALVLIFVARPAAVFLSLIPSKMNVRQKLFISWVGLRGAVPIILATYPMLFGLPQADENFHIVFFVVVTSVLLQGTTLERVAYLLRLAEPADSLRPAALRFAPVFATDNQLLELEVKAGSAVEGKQVQDVDLPEDALVVLITRRDLHMVAQRGTRLEAGDQATVLASGRHAEAVRSRFEAAGEESPPAV